MEYFALFYLNFAVLNLTFSDVDCVILLDNIVFKLRHVVSYWLIFISDVIKYSAKIIHYHRMASPLHLTSSLLSFETHTLRQHDPRSLEARRQPPRRIRSATCGTLAACGRQSSGSSATRGRAHALALSRTSVRQCESTRMPGATASGSFCVERGTWWRRSS